VKVLIISAAFPPMKAGEVDQAVHLCRRLTAKGLDVHVLTTEKNLASIDVPASIYPVMRDWSWSDLPMLARVIKRCSPDAVLLFYSGWIYGYHAMITFAPTLCKMLLPGVTFVTQFGIPDGAQPENASVLGKVARKGAVWLAGKREVDYNFGTLLRDSDRIIVFSEFHGDWLKSRAIGLAVKCLLIPPPPPVHLCAEDGGASRKTGRARLGAGDDDFIIAFFGYAYRNKGLETLVQAFSMLNGDPARRRLVFIGGRSDSREGSSYAAEIVELCRELRVDDNVIWTGEYSWDSDEGSLYLRAADLCVLPFDDGVMLNRSSFAVAAAHGLPIVTTQGSKLESQFEDGKNIILCPPKDPARLAAAIESIANHPELRARLRKGALQLAENWFSWDKAIKRTIDALHSGGNPNKRAHATAAGR
jgi:polysaccharide biosynthesis protein PslF